MCSCCCSVVVLLLVFCFVELDTDLLYVSSCLIRLAFLFSSSTLLVQKRHSKHSAKEMARGRDCCKMSMDKSGYSEIRQRIEKVCQRACVSCTAVVTPNSPEHCLYLRLHLPTTKRQRHLFFGPSPSRTCHGTCQWRITEQCSS